MPGIGPALTVALLLPVTYRLDATGSLIMFAGIYYGGMYGGSTTSILLNTPGESASVVTCLDGHQMALQGRAGPALGIAAIASFIAGTIGVFLLMLVSPLLARWSLAFGPPENFALMLLGLTTVTLLTGESPVKGYISMVLGLMLATVGFDIVSGDARFAFGVPEMMDGIDFLPVAIGLFTAWLIRERPEDVPRALAWPGILTVAAFVGFLMVLFTGDTQSLAAPDDRPAIWPLVILEWLTLIGVLSWFVAVSAVLWQGRAPESP